MADLSKTIIKSISGKSGAMRPYIITDKTDSCELSIQYGSKLYQPPLEEGVEWETERKGSPGKLTFTVIQDGSLKYDYGSTVIFKYGGKNVFYGHIFKIHPTNDGRIQMTAYDQLRYFKNKDTYVYTNKRLDQLVKMIATDFKLRTGTIENTGYAMSRVEDNKTLFDIELNAADETMLKTGKMFVLYDDFGKLTLKNVSSMKITTLIDEETAQDYDYTGSIDDETYNKIKVYYDDNGTRGFYIAQDASTQNKWGVLQNSDKASSKSTAMAQAKAMLASYNTPTRSLSVKNVFGNVSARAGVLMPVMLDLGDIKVSNYMQVEKARHIFKSDEYTMDLTLKGNSFI